MKKLLYMTIIFSLVLLTACDEKTKEDTSTHLDGNSKIESSMQSDVSVDDNSVVSTDIPLSIEDSKSEAASNQTSVQEKQSVSPVTTNPPAASKTTTEKPQTTKPATTTTWSGSSNTSYISEVLRLVNIERANAGHSPLSSNAQLNNAAQVRANEIIGTPSHTRPDGTKCFTVLKEFNISYSRAGENIAWGQKTPQEVVTAWMNSEGHRDNIMNPQFTQLGVGYITGGSYGHNWAQLFIA